MAQYKVAVIGEKTDVLGFIAIGFEAYPADTVTEAEKIIKELVKTENYAVIFLKDSLASQMEDVLAKYRYNATPAIIVIPGSEDSTGYGLAEVKECVEKAVGADILFKES